VTPRPPRRRSKVSITAEARRLFLETIAAGWSAERAAEVAGVAKQRFYERRQQDEAFAQAWQDAYDTGTDALRDELRRRATEGYTETVLDADGNIVRRTERMNPADLHLELKRRDPSYREGAQVGIAFGGQPPGEIQHERGLTLGDVAAYMSAQQVQDAITRFKEQVVRLAERRALTAEDVRQVQVVSQLEDVGLIGEDGAPLMKDGGGDIAGEEFRPMRELMPGQPNGNGLNGNETKEAG
jgi:response regulator RpfG family c-di-GMP phosphodiesterase